jgi:hypothetical protein
MRVYKKYMPVSVRDRETRTAASTGKQERTVCGIEGHVGNHGDDGTAWCETCRAIEAEKRAKETEQECERVYVVHWSNHHPREVESIWRFRADAERHANLMGGDWRVETWYVTGRDVT